MLDVMWFSIGIALCIVIKIVAHFLPKKEWVGLTDEERSELWWNIDMNGMPEHDYGKAIEAKLKEKNSGNT